MQLLLIIDVQGDFIDGALGTPEARAGLPRIRDFVARFEGLRLCTLDSHGANYLESLEGRCLPVVHAQLGTPGHALAPELQVVLPLLEPLEH